VYETIPEQPTTEEKDLLMLYSHEQKSSVHSTSISVTLPHGFCCSILLRMLLKPGANSLASGQPVQRLPSEIA
jgi:hypothetical protein